MIPSSTIPAERPSLNDLPEVLTPEDLWNYLPIGRNAVYDLLKMKRIKSTRVGQKFIITKNALRSFLDGGELK
jgi:excisionase family DNA binding protein